MTERLIIDLAACDACQACCTGALLALRERATFELVCRRCELASCVLACPFDALERTEQGIIKRHNMRCVSCKSCSLACPFGTIYAELLPFYSMDYEQAAGFMMGAGAAAAARSTSQNGSQPTPIPDFNCSAVLFGEVDTDDPDIHVIDEFLAARARRWSRDDRGEEAA